MPLQVPLRFFEWAMRKYERLAQKGLDALSEALCSRALRVLSESGLGARAVPETHLSWLTGAALRAQAYRVHGWQTATSGTVAVAGAMAVALSRQRMYRRCLWNAAVGRDDAQVLQRELQAAPHTQLDAGCGEWPELVVFELENDLTVWPRQVEVAQRMMWPVLGEGECGATVQQNMGEGKTSVTMPLASATLADGTVLVRIVVPQSLHRANLQVLRFKLGGFLARRVYEFPVRRDQWLSGERVEGMRRAMEQCRGEGGVVVAVPEHLQSLRLRLWDVAYRSGVGGVHVPLAELHNMLNAQARDLFDEVDDVLHHRHELVYSVGDRCGLAGGALRWHMMHAVLDAVARVAPVCGLEGLECHDGSDVAGAYPVVRLVGGAELEGAAGRQLCALLVDDLFGTRLTYAHDTVQQLFSRECGGAMREMVLSETLSRKTEEWFAGLLVDDEEPDDEEGDRDGDRDGDEDGGGGREKWDEGLVSALLVLRGHLALGVLRLALSKRWRVQYGVPEAGLAGGLRMMAVPFRAKDTPVERTEFGDADVALTLTALSFLHSGLRDCELLEVLRRLRQLPGCEHIYASWIAGLAVEPSLRDVTGLNELDTSRLQRELFPHLRHNSKAVAFYLSELVFPREAKQFPQKMSASAWQLCGHGERALPVTGFSGTNDTRLLMPRGVRAHGLSALRQTNAEVCANLLHADNNNYRRLAANLTGEQLLVQLMVTDPDKPPFHVLIDCGAMVLDLDNRTLARKWLARCPEAPAAAFFDEHNTLLAMDREGREVELALSTYAHDLSRCLLYIDHGHTRGTDVRLPSGTHAALTVGKGVRKDELLQAAMRMRKLGQGHTVSFFVAADVHRELEREHSQGTEGTGGETKEAGEGERVFTHAGVLAWALRQSVKATCDGFLSWALHGHSFLREQSLMRASSAPHGRLEFVTDATELHHKAQARPRRDAIDLRESFASSRELTALPVVIARLFGASAAQVDATELVAQCRAYALTVECLSCTADEEQEREIEEEPEMEREMCQNTVLLEPLHESVSVSLMIGARTGVLPSRNASDLVSAWTVFDPSSAVFRQLCVPPIAPWEKRMKKWRDSHGRLERNMWGPRETRVWLGMTRSYIATVTRSVRDRNEGKHLLRPAHWLVHFTRDNHSVLVSPTEANALLLPRHSAVCASVSLYALLPRIRRAQPVTLLPVLHPSAPLPPRTFALLAAFSGTLYFDEAQSERTPFENVWEHPYQRTAALKLYDARGLTKFLRFSDVRAGLSNE